MNVKPQNFICCSCSFLAQKRKIFWDCLLSHRFHSPNPGHSPKLDKFQTLLIFNRLCWKDMKKTPKAVYNFRILSKLFRSVKGGLFESEGLLWKKRKQQRNTSKTKIKPNPLYIYISIHIPLNIFQLQFFLGKYPNLIMSFPLPPTMQCCIFGKHKSAFCSVFLWGKRDFHVQKSAFPSLIRLSNKSYYHLFNIFVSLKSNGTTTIPFSLPVNEWNLQGLNNHVTVPLIIIQKTAQTKLLSAFYVLQILCLKLNSVKGAEGMARDT